MIQSFLKYYNKLIVLIIALTGTLTGCQNTPGTTNCEYGTPYAKFKINGLVTNKITKQPVENIGIIPYLKKFYNNTVNYVIIDTLKTGSSGTYTVDIEMFPESDSVYLHFFDIDSTINMSYKRHDTVLFFDASKLTGNDGWYAGGYSTTCNIELSKNN